VYNVNNKSNQWRKEGEKWKQMGGEWTEGKGMGENKGKEDGGEQERRKNWKRGEERVGKRSRVT